MSSKTVHSLGKVHSVNSVEETGDGRRLPFFFAK